MEQRFRDARDAQFSMEEEIDYQSEAGRRALAERMNFADDPFLIECYEPPNSRPCLVAQRLLAEYIDHCKHCGCQCQAPHAGGEEVHADLTRDTDVWWEDQSREKHRQQTTRHTSYSRPAACMLFNTHTRE